MFNTILIIWVGEQWKKYINFFQNKPVHITGVCQSQASQSLISKKYDIQVIIWLSWKVHFKEYDLIIIALPVKIQWTTALNILNQWYSWKIIVDTPVSWDNTVIQSLMDYDNVSFFLEEYYTLFAKLLRKSEQHISNIHIRLYIPENEYTSCESKSVGLLHIHNNFLWFSLQYTTTIIPTKADTMRYEIVFRYQNVESTYKFSHDWVLILGNKTYNDPINFDLALEQLLQEEKNIKLYYSQDF